MERDNNTVFFREGEWELQFLMINMIHQSLKEIPKLKSSCCKQVKKTSALIVVSNS
jgi:hypothetical protein